MIAMIAFSFFSVVRATNPSGFPNSLGITPPRGARTWNSYREAIDQSLILSAVDGLVSPLPGGGSLAASLFNDYGIDDGWEECINGTFHDGNGNPMVNATRFYNMTSLTSHAKSLGLTMSWYMNCCGCAERSPTLTHYAQDAAATARLGFSGLKVDGCGNEPNITAWAVATNSTGAPIMLENCNDDHPFRPTVNPDGTVFCPYNFFRTSIDGAPNFRSTISNVMNTLLYMNISSPGCFAYADMMTFGVPAFGFEQPAFFNNCGRRMSEDEARTQFAAFSLLSSPLILGFDTANETERATWAPIVTHPATLAANAVWDGEAGRLVASSSSFDTVPVAVGGMCELIQNHTLPAWVVVGKRLASNADGTTSRFAAILLAGNWSPSIDFDAPLEAMGFSSGVTVEVFDGWTGSRLSDVTGSWSGNGITSPGGLYRFFSLA